MKPSRLASWGVLGLSVLCAGSIIYRYLQIERTLEPEELVLEPSHNLSWNPSTGIFESLGTDPFGFIELPAGLVPLYQLRLDFAGPYHHGGWYVYPSPAHLNTPEINQDWVVTARVEERGEDHSLIWDLDATQLVRIDFPDNLDRPMALQRAVFSTRFYSSHSPAIAGMIIAASAVLLLLARGHLRRLLARRSGRWAIMASLIGLKLWMTSGFDQTIMAHLKHDDRLFLDQAASILAGNWLGDYHSLTLCKGPVFPLFIAGASLTGWSLQVCEVLFHALACGILVWSLVPLVPRGGVQLLLFACLLLEPNALSGAVLSQVSRGGIQPALAILTIAGFIGMITRCSGNLRHLAGWSIMAGLSLVFFWFSREEGIWILPSALLLTGAAAWQGRNQRGLPRVARLICLLTPLVMLQGGKVVLRWVNDHHYGSPITIDTKDSAFPAAYGATLRVIGPDEFPEAPVTHRTREIIYEISATFAELRSHLEGPVKRTWSQFGWDHVDHPRAHTEIRAGWYQWALREAAARAGWHGSPRTAHQKWQAVADEINQAVESGQIEGRSHRDGFFPVWRATHVVPAMKNWIKSIDLLVRCTDFKPHAVPSTGPPEDVARLAAMVNATAAGKDKRYSQATHARIIWRQGFVLVGWPLTAMALGFTLILLWRARLRPALHSAAAILLALWGGAAALALVIALVDVSAFSAIHGAYLAPAAPMIIACWILAPEWARRSRPRDPTDHQFRAATGSEGTAVRPSERAAESSSGSD